MIREFATREAAMDATALRMADALNAGIAARGQACAALSGGSTPGPAYERLAPMPLDWAKITFALVDERFVPPEDPASNEALARQTLARALSEGARIAPMYAPISSASEAAAIANTAYGALDIDLALMGMGEDGHTASWFPGEAAHAALNPSETRSVIAVHAPGARGASERLTLTYAAIKRVRSLLLLITGDAKRATLEAALAPASRAPVAALFAERATEVFWAP